MAVTIDMIAAAIIAIAAVNVLLQQTTFDVPQATHWGGEDA